MRIKIGDLVESNHNNSPLLDVGIVIDIKKEKRSPTKIKIFWQKAKLCSPWLRPGLFRRVKQDTNPDGGRAP
jgi:hypothetical protein